jgi:hypothetical protein
MPTVRLVEPAADEHRIGARRERLGEPSAGAERGGLGETVADLRELEDLEAPVVHHDDRPSMTGAEIDG